MSRHIVLVTAIVLFASASIFAQGGSAGSSNDVGYWVDYWSRPQVVLFGSAEEAFNSGMQVVLFRLDNHDDPTNPTALDGNIQWLKDHPNVHFYVHGYASSRGDLIYNLNLSQRRADWVKQTLISRGIPESRIQTAVGWGELYPVCPEENDECWSKNKLVRFVYAPD